MEYRWLSNPEIETFVQEVCDRHNWMPLNINEAQPTCRVLGAFDGIEMVGFICLQLMPYLGPEWVTKAHRGDGVAEELTKRMGEFLTEVEARGCLVIAGSPFTVQLAERHGMAKLEHPAYIWNGVDHG